MAKQLYMVGLDGSDWSERAAERAINLAIKVDAHVCFVYVCQWSNLSSVMLEEAVIELPTVNKAVEEDSIKETVIDPLLERYQSSGVTIRYKIGWGDPVEELLSQVKQEHANMLFVGRRGRSRFIDILLGSVANKLAHRIGIPLVLVP